MGRSVSYPSGAVVAFTVLEVEDDDDWDFEYEWLREDLRERAGQAFPSLIAHDGWRAAKTASSCAMPMQISACRFTPAWLRCGLSSVTMAPIGMPIGARPDRPEHSAGCPRSPRALKRCSATTSASVTCRTVRASTQNG